MYKAGFAGTQEAYEKAVYPLFKSLDSLEKRLTGKDYLVGDTLTEADIRLFVTIVSVSIRARDPNLNQPLLDRFVSTQYTLGTLNATCVRFGTGILPFTREILMAHNRSRESLNDRSFVLFHT